MLRLPTSSPETYKAPMFLYSLWNGHVYCNEIRTTSQTYTEMKLSNAETNLYLYNTLKHSNGTVFMAPNLEKTCSVISKENKIPIADVSASFSSFR